MAMGGMTAGGRGRRRRSINSDINVTPLVDVMLVLLVIFMITAPMMTVAVPVDLPKTQARNVGANKEPLVISVRANGDLYLMESKATLDNLAAKLGAVTGQDPEARIFVRGDKNVDYGRIMQVMGAVSTAGYTKVALVAELPGQSPDKPADKRR